MTGQDDQFKQAVDAFKAGRKTEARNLLMDIVDKDERHEQAWLYLSALVETDEERQICLENVLEINPDNDRASKGLDKVKQKIAERPPGESPPASATPSEPSMLFPAATDSSTENGDAPFSTLDWDTMPTPADEPAVASSPPIGAEFGSSSGDALVDDMPGGFPSPDSIASGAADDDSLDWLNDETAAPLFPPPDQTGDPLGAASSDPFAAPNVDWNASDMPATPNSSPGDDLSSTQEYDDWVQKLNTKDDDVPVAPAAETAADNLASPFTADAPGPFSGTDFMLGDDTLGGADSQVTAEAGSDDGAFGGDVFGSGAEPSWDGADSGLSSGGDTAAANDSFGGFDSSDTAKTPDPFSADNTFDAAPQAPAASSQHSGSLFDDDYAEDDELGDDVFGSSTVFEADEPLFGADDDEGDLDFSFDEDDDSFLDDAPAKSAAETKKARRAKKTKKAKQLKAAPAIDPAHAKYFALIPAEIEAKGGSSVNGTVVFGILIMLALNAAGYAAYFLELI